ncbi:GH25 family lysozyme [Pseudarthrobacter sp. NPDC092424]|uniref:GH25 family lysozyme n=1 Tax=Pseudarthrobacter sp. NPDC092424 TaxID=3364415 RepID=UPI0037FA85CC
MKPNHIQPVWRPTFVKSLTVVVVAAVAAVGLPAQAVALEPAPAVSATPAGDPTVMPSPTPTTQPTDGAAPEMSSPATEPGETVPLDLKRLQDEIGANGAHMGQGLKSKQTGSPRSGKTESLSEMVQTQNTWQAPGIQGLDVSSHQPTVDWPAQYSMGARFAYVKASEGLTYRSPTFNSQYAGAQGVGMLRGAYHFALPSISTGAAQADYFVNSGGGWSPDGKTMPPLLDIEYNPYSSLGNTCYNMSASAMVNWIKDFSNRILSRTGRLPMIYTTTDWWKQCTGNSGAFGNHPLHLASYGKYVGSMPNGWGTYSVWQYSSTGPFAGDSNAWNGSYANLQKFAAAADGAIPKPSIMSTGDVVAADASGALWDYPATGTGTFGARQQIGQGWTGLRSINVIDWNADGVLDLVAQWTAGRVAVYIGLAAGGFSTGPVLASSGWGGYQLTVGYWLSGSYYPQILTRDEAGNLTFWRNSSGAGLGTAARIGQGWGDLNLTMIDFDGDGNEDILAQDPEGTLRQYRSNGSGSFIPESRPAVGSGWHQMTSVSVTFAFKGNTSSGIMARSTDGSLKYFPVPGNSTWGSSSVIGTGWDGFLIAGGETINTGSTAPPPPAETVNPSIKAASDLVTIDSDGRLFRRSASAGALGSPVQIGTGFTGIASVHVTDWNADGVQDLATVSEAGDLGLRLGQKAGGFAAPTTLLAGLADADVTFGPWIKGAAYPGLIVRRPDSTVAFYGNAAGAAVSAPSVIGRGFVRMDVTMLDADSDGRQDLVAVDNVGQMTLFRSNGTGTFTAESRPQIGKGWNAMNSISPALGFTGDGSTGLMARDSKGTLSYYPLSNRLFGPRTAFGPGWTGTLIAGSRLISPQQPIEGQADVLRVDSAGKLWTYPANGNGSLTAPYQIGTGWSSAKSLHVVDWNKDGIPDVLAQWSSGALTVYFGSRAGSFSGPVTLAASGFSETTFVTGRWTTAGSYPGLVGYHSDGVLRYWANTSGGALGAPKTIGKGWNTLKLAMTDFDGDARQDLLAVDPSGAMRLFRSNGSGTFVAESRRTVGVGWQSFRAFFSTGGFAGTGSKGIMALQTDGSLAYYPLLGSSRWGTRSTAGSVGSSPVVSSNTSAY